ASGAGREAIAVLHHEELVTAIAFSLDGQRLLTASHRHARLWDAASGKQVAMLSGHREMVTSAAFSPDGQRVLTASNDGDARLWRVFPSPQELVDDARRRVPRGLSRAERIEEFLDPEPPAWLIDLNKYPYATAAWAKWLEFKRAKENPPLPHTDEWPAWLAA